MKMWKQNTKITTHTTHISNATSIYITLIYTKNKIHYNNYNIIIMWDFFCLLAKKQILQIHR